MLTFLVLYNMTLFLMICIFGLCNMWWPRSLHGPLEEKLYGVAPQPRTLQWLRGSNLDTNDIWIMLWLNFLVGICSLFWTQPGQIVLDSEFPWICFLMGFSPIPGLGSTSLWFVFIASYESGGHEARKWPSPPLLPYKQHPVSQPATIWTVVSELSSRVGQHMEVSITWIMDILHLTYDCSVVVIILSQFALCSCSCLWYYSHKGSAILVCYSINTYTFLLSH